MLVASSIENHTLEDTRNDEAVDLQESPNEGSSQFQKRSSCCVDLGTLEKMVRFVSRDTDDFDIIFVAIAALSCLSVFNSWKN